MPRVVNIGADQASGQLLVEFGSLQHKRFVLHFCLKVLLLVHLILERPTPLSTWRYRGMSRIETHPVTWRIVTHTKAIQEKREHFVG
jgi:hypothetical protein